MVADEIAWIYNVRKCQVFFKGSLVMQSSVEQHTCSKKRGGAVQHTSFFFTLSILFKGFFISFFLTLKNSKLLFLVKRHFSNIVPFSFFFSFFRLVVFSILLFFFSLLSNVLLYQAHLRFQLLLFLPERTVWSIYEGQVYLCNKTLRCLTLALRG